MNIAERLDQAMHDARFGSNQSALSRASGVPQPTINRILKGGGKRGPETETIKKLAAACEVNFQWLMEGTGEKMAGESKSIPPGEEELIDLYRKLPPTGDESRQWVLSMARMLIENNRRKERQDAPVEIHKPKRRGNA